MPGKWDQFLGRYTRKDVGETGAAGEGVPTGGTTGQILAKASGTNYDTEWIDETGGVSSNFLAVWFESIAAGTGGTLSAPAGGTLSADQWPDGADALATTLDASGRPTWQTPRTAAGSLVTATLDTATGAWTLSGTPAAYPVGIVFAYTIPVASFDEDYALVGPDYVGDEPMTAVSTPADSDKLPVWQSGSLKYRLWSAIKATFDLSGTASSLLSTHETTHPAPTTRDSRNEAALVNNRVTNAFLNDMATQTLKGRNTAGTGDPEDLSVATVKTMLGLLLHKLDATAAPTANDDTNDGYAPGSVWIDLTNDKAYVCLDATATAAVWTETTQAAGAGGGKLLQRVVHTQTAVGSFTGDFPIDTSIPQSSEGTQTWSGTFTPTSAASKICATAYTYFSCSAAVSCRVGIWWSESTDAIDIAPSVPDSGPHRLVLCTGDLASPGTDELTFQIRAGLYSGTGYYNEFPANNFWGNATRLVVVIEEFST